MPPFLVGLAIFLATGIIIHYLKRLRIYKEAAKFPGPPTLPIIGNALYFIGNTQDLLSKCEYLLNTYSSPFRVWLAHRLAYVIYDPEQLKTVLLSEKAIEKEELYKFWSVWIGDGLMTAPASKWKAHRKLISPAFGKQVLESFAKVFSKQSNIIVKEMEVEVNRKEFDTHHYVSLCTLDMICEAAMGVSTNLQTNKDTNYRKAADRLLEIIYTRAFNVWLHPDFIINRTKIGKEMRKCLNIVHEFTKNLIKQKRSALNSKKNQHAVDEKRKAFLELLIERSDTGMDFTDQELQDEVDTLLLVGHDATAMMNCYIILILASYPEVQDKVYEELYGIYGNEDPSIAPIKHEDLHQMEYLGRVIKETMRIFPLVPMVFRRLTDDLKMGDYTLTKGSSVVLALYKTHRSEKYWKDPLKFDPDRFLPEECTKRHPYAFIPFSAGPRNCIGMKFAMMSMKTLIATILRNYVIKKNKIVPISDIKLKIDIAMKTVDPITIRIERRAVLLSQKTIEKEELYKFWSVWVGEGLLTGPASTWKAHRKLISPAFNKQVLESSVKVFSNQSNIMLKEMEVEVDGEEFNIHPYVSLCTLDMICDAAMGVSMNLQTNKDMNYKKDTEIIYTRQFNVCLHPDFIINRTKIGQEMHKCLNVVHDFSKNLIKKKRRALNSKENQHAVNDKRKKGFLELLIERTDTGIDFTDQDLQDEVDTFLLAGYETTASMNGFIILILATHLEVQDKVYEELHSIYGNEDPSISPIKYEDLHRMEYLERVIKETMRIFPLAPVIVRRVTDDLKIGDYTLMKGSSVALALYKTHRSEEYWKDPLKFDPDRFLPEECAKRHPYAFIHFSAHTPPQGVLRLAKMAK